MDLPSRYSVVGMAILEQFVATPEPLSSKQVKERIPAEFREKAKYQYSSMIRANYLISKGVDHKNHPLFVATRKGRDLVANKSKIQLVEVVNESANKYRERQLDLAATGELSPKRPYKKKQKIEEPASPALPHVSTNANNLMDNISQVIHENAAYREALLSIGNQIAGLLDMILMPRPKGQND